MFVKYIYNHKSIFHVYFQYIRKASIPNEIFFEIQVLDNTRKRLDFNQIDY